MSFYFLLRVFALCVLALLVAADSPNHAGIHGRSTIKTANKLSCIKLDVSLVKKEVSHPLEFCKFYLSDKRSRSPLPSLGVTALQKACKCIQASPPPEPTIIHGNLPSSKQCSQWTKLLKGEYKHVAEFCDFYLGYRIYSASHFVIQSCDGAGLCVQNLTITSRNEVVNLGDPFFDNLGNKFGDTRSPHRVRIYRDICFFIASHSIADFWFFCFHSIQIV
ncbi:unnamed protein product [Aureobasidium pullulans]|nr:unnamed protein product [Aureobasidium pullulans]